jgi:hypothetical protein
MEIAPYVAMHVWHMCRDTVTLALASDSEYMLVCVFVDIPS